MPDDAKTGADKNAVVKVFGIRNCDTCRKALKWLNEHGVSHRFHDVRERAPSASLVRLWCESSHGNKIVNRRSTTWRALNGQQRAAALANPAPSLLEHPTLIKRPVFMCGREVLGVGFYPKDLEGRLPR